MHDALESEKHVSVRPILIQWVVSFMVYIYFFLTNDVSSIRYLQLSCMKRLYRANQKQGLGDKVEDCKH